MAAILEWGYSESGTRHLRLRL